MERRFSPIGMEFAWPSFDVDSKREPTMQTIVIYITLPILFFFGLGLASLFFSNRDADGLPNENQNQSSQS